MVDVTALALVVAGAVILFAGAALSVYGVALLGAVVGGGSGYLLAPELGFTATLELAAVALVGVVAGVALSYLLLSMAIGAFAFVVGSYVGATGAEWLLDDPGLLLIAVGALVAGVAAAFLATILKRTVMMFVTSFAGAALVSRSVTVEEFEEAALFDPDPILFDLGAPLFLGLFALGVLTQLGLFKFGYVARLVTLLPGASILRDRGDENGS